MPRTKMNRNPTSKRLRRDSAELEEYLRDYDIEGNLSINVQH